MLHLLEDNVGRWVEIEDGKIVRCGYTNYIGGLVGWSGPDRKIRDFVDNISEVEENE